MKAPKTCNLNFVASKGVLYHTLPKVRSESAVTGEVQGATWITPFLIQNKTKKRAFSFYYVRTHIISFINTRYLLRLQMTVCINEALFEVIISSRFF